MTKSKKNRFLRFATAVAVVCSAVSFSVLSLKASANYDASIVNASAFETDGQAWKYEETVARPTGSLSYGGETKTADVKVIFPNGKESVGVGDAITLNVEGQYTVEYSATFGNDTIVETSTFVIAKDLFYVSGNESSARYYNYVYSEHVSEELSATRDSVKTSSVSGVYVSLKTGDVFEYSRVIDLNTLTREDDLFKIVIAPEEIGKKDVTDFYITLTDAYDPTNYITIKSTSITDTPIMYMSVAASNGQQLTGWQYSKPPSKYVGKNGAPMRYGMTGPCLMTEQTVTDGSNVWEKHNDYQFDINSIADNDFAISIDYATKEVFNTLSTNYPNESNYPSGKRPGVIADLDDPADFEKVWGGFTTGECYLSIKGGTYVGETFNFMITEINGIEGGLSNADATREEEIFRFDDRGTLDIDVAFGKYENSIPLAKVGVEYPLFSATSLNQYFGLLNATYEVKKGDTVVARNGEKFIPQETGEYTVVYTVEDYFKKQSTKSFTVAAVEATPEGNFELEGGATTGVAGNFVSLHEAVSRSGGAANGIFDVVMTVTEGEENFEVVDGKFFPTRAGEYTVTVTAVDYIGQSYGKTYTVVVEAGECPVYLSTPVLPKYFISGRTYVLPSMTAYDYTDGSGTAIKAKVAYVDGEGTKRALEGRITPVANALKDTLDIVYYTSDINAENGYATNLAFKDIPIITAVTESKGKYSIDYSKLFATSGAYVETTRDSTSIKTESDGSVEFINPLGASGLTMRFKGVQTASNFGAFVITMSDSQNPDQTIKLYYAPADEKTSTFTINSLTGTKYTASQSFFGENTFSLEYDSVNGVKFDPMSSVYAAVKTYANGEAFQGFDSGKVYVSYGFEGVTGKAEVKLTQLAGQKITNQTVDRGDPVLSIDSEYLGYVGYGEQIRIPKAVFTDLVDPYVIGQVTVQTPEDANGKRRVVKTLDGLYLNAASTDREYYIEASMYGTYLITFSAKDFAGNEFEYAYYVNVVDTVAPVITLPENVVTEGKVNKTITLSKATVSDNVEGEIKLTVYVYSPSMVMYELKNGDYSFKTNKAGKYQIVYVAVDAAGNYALKTVTLTVTE